MSSQSSVIRDDDNLPTSNWLSLPKRKRLLLSAMAAATTALIVAIAVSSAPAQQAPERKWSVDCSGPGKVRDCRAVQHFLQRETGQWLVAEVRSPDGKTGEMMMTLPHGHNLTEPVLVKVDNGASERLIKTCTNLGCYVTLTEKLIGDMRTGSDLKITVQDANKKPLEISLPLFGFGTAFDGALFH
jgi:invasion protein IalB